MMKNSRLLSILAAAVITVSGGIVPTSHTIAATKPMTVVKNDYTNHWGKQEIEWAVKQKLMWLNPDGTFRPDETITQAQFLMSLVAIENLKEKAPFPSVGNHWAKEAYEKAAKAGWMTPDIKIQPNAPITRYEAAAWITNAWGHKRFDPLEYTYLNHLLISSHKFREGVYNPTKTKLATRDQRYFKTTALPTDRFTRAETAHTLSMISVRKANIEEARKWVSEIQRSLQIKNGMLYGKVPNIPNVPYVKHAGFGYWNGNTRKTLSANSNFAVPADGFLGLAASFDSVPTVNFRWELPSLKVVDVFQMDFEKDPHWNNRNQK